MHEKIIRLVYLSHASSKFKISDLDQIEAKSLTNNKLSDITSLLIFDGWGFVHIIEGPDQNVRELFYNHIFRDKRHHNIFVIEAGSILSRMFPEWPTRVIDASAMEDIRATTLEFMIDAMEEDFHFSPIMEWVEITLGKVELAEHIQ